MRSILIIGHRQPDTDSICSVIGYAELLNATSPESYVPARCGELNGETSFALSRFGVEPPLFVESVEPNVSDLPFTYLVSAGEDVPAIDVAAMMEQHDMRNMPITDAGGRFVGLVSEHGLAVAYVRRIDREQLSLARIRLETLARILDAGILVNASEILEGNVYIAIDALHVALSRLTRNDVAVVGDNEPSQLALISAGIAALIIADGAPVGERVITAAKEKGVSILATRLDAFGAGKMIHLSLPAREVMTTDVPRVDMQDSLEYAKQIATNNPYRTACVTDKDGMLLGMISRNTLLDEVQKPVILLDHNEYSQAVDGIEDAEILEIIDHHRLGAISTLKPVRFLNDPVGSTCTIITRKFVEAGVIP
ncbi:MAG: putative manganese-dependent inorganic diphosphatase, partial [Methanoregulaceae archaeon]|nr:putative manganese-dependent inorganic diphosphatase [Methanoregulaceae archaeon]